MESLVELPTLCIQLWLRPNNSYLALHTTCYCNLPAPGYTSFLRYCFHVCIHFLSLSSKIAGCWAIIQVLSSLAVFQLLKRSILQDYIRHLTPYTFVDKKLLWSCDCPQSLGQRNMFAEMMLLNYQPFNILNNVSFRRFLQEPRYSLLSHRHLHDVIKFNFIWNY